MNNDQGLSAAVVPMEQLPVLTSGKGVPKRTGCAFGGVRGPPYRPLLNSDNGILPAMSSGRRPGGVPGPQNPGGGPWDPSIVRREGGHRL